MGNIYANGDLLYSHKSSLFPFATFCEEPCHIIIHFLQLDTGLQFLKRSRDINTKGFLWILQQDVYDLGHKRLLSKEKLDIICHHTHTKSQPETIL